MLNDSFHRPGGGLARTVVVAVATLSILLVCFSIYQHSQLDATATSVPRGPRLPDPGAAPVPEPEDQPSGVNVSGAVIGKSRDVKISLYPREGRESKMELTVTDWSPKAGSDHEFVLRDPEIRMRTAEGNDLRVKALEGSLEARRKSGSGLEPQRGRLVGDVLIEFDRRSQKDKDKLSEEERNKTTDADLVRVRAPELEFDVEFGRLTMPGRVVLTARDAGLEASDIEIQFNQQDDRVETLRIERGGRIELLSRSDELGVSTSDPGAQPTKRTLVDWMRETLQARIDAQAVAKAAASSPSPGAEKPTAPAQESDPSIPVFKMATAPRPRTAARYVGRFEGNVDARQQIGDVTQSRLEADWLEVLRELTLDEGKKAQTPQRAAEQTAGAVAPSEPVVPEERIVLTWEGKLLVTEAPPPGEESSGTQVTAGGKPARLSHPEGDATCLNLVYKPDTGDLKLSGDREHPVLVRSIEQGTVLGESISVRRDKDALEIVVGGSGRIWETPPATAAAGSTPVQISELGPASIEFEKGLHALGSVRNKTTLDFTGSITTREYQLLDTVTFDGRTTMRQDQTAFVADSVKVDFSVIDSWRGLRQTVEMVTGVGNVSLLKDDDRLGCERMEIAMETDGDGKPAVRTATAYRSVHAVQGDRTLQASDKLIVDFAPAPESAAIDQEADKSNPPVPSGGGALAMDLGGSTAAKRLRAFGNVGIIDPSQSLDLNCEQLDCALSAGDIESARLIGVEDRPATVKLDTFGVTGNDITLDVVNEWADVPGQGRMTILSRKDLDGRKADEPIPIVVTWTESMRYRGRENRAVFSGNVHASSQTTTTFDCETLLVEFEENTGKPAPAKRKRGMIESLGLQGPLGAMWPGFKQPEPEVFREFTREPRYVEATGNAVAQTAELHPSTGAMKSRARISGPKLSLHLRSELSKLLIEGAGDLMLEDFQAAGAAPPSSQEGMRADLFSDESDAGPSKTLIKWRDRMWYDFGIDQTLFEGDVKLTHLSGAELDKVFGVPQGGTPNTSRGRRTFLDSDTLTVDFADAPKSARRQSEQRMGRISSDRLRRFRAGGRVALREEVDQFALSAEEVIYERPRKTLLIHGAPNRKAQLIRQRPGKLPDQMAAERIFFNLETGKIEISGPHIRSGQ